MLGSKYVKYKKIVSFILLVFCIVLVGVTTFGLILNLTPNNVSVIRTTSGIIKFELTDEVTREDDTIEKLTPKIKISSTGATGELGTLVRVTANDVMFDYTVNDETFYFKAIGNSLNTTSQTIYTTAVADTSISSSNGWNTFVYNVNNKKIDYSGSYVYLTADINFSGKTITPVGYGGQTPAVSFKGTFDGKGHSIKNFKLGPGIYSGTVGLFGSTEGATIKNLNIEDGTIDFTDSTREYYKEFGIDWWNGYRGIVDLDGCYSMAIIPLNIGFVVGEMTGGTILNCRVGSSCSITVKAISLMNGGFYDNSNDSNQQLNQFIGGVVGAAYGTIKDCESHVSITAYNKNQREFCVSGICGGWSNYKQSLDVNNCLFKGNVKIIDQSESTFNPTYLSYGGIVGGGYRLNFYSNDTFSTVKINNCVAILDDFQLDGCNKDVAKKQFDSNSSDNMVTCRYSFQPIFSLVPVHRPPSVGFNIFNYCGYTYRQIKGSSSNIQYLFSTDTSKRNYYTINSNQSSNFFLNCVYLINQNKDNKVSSRFHEGARYGDSGYYYNK